MPRISDKVTINNRSLDRRVKITEQDKKKIREWYFEKRFTIRGIAKLVPFSRRSIQFILFPERMEKVQERAKEIKRWSKYNKKEIHTPAMRRHRAYKKQLWLEGKIK